MPLCLSESGGGGWGVGTGGLGTSHLFRLERSTVGSTWGRGFGGLGVGLVLGLAMAGG